MSSQSSLPSVGVGLGVDPVVLLRSWIGLGLDLVASRVWIGRSLDSVVLPGAWVGLGLDEVAGRVRIRRELDSARRTAVRTHGPARTLIFANTDFLTALDSKSVGASIVRLPGDGEGLRQYIVPWPDRLRLFGSAPDRPPDVILFAS